MPKTPKVPYSKDNLQKATEAVQDVSNNLSTRQIAEKYGVPRSSLRYHIKNPFLHLFLCHLCFEVDDSVSGDSDSSTSANKIFDLINKAKRNLF